MTLDHVADERSAKVRIPAVPVDTTVVGCPECDLLVRLMLPAPGQSARCPRCGCVLTSGIRDGFLRPLAYAVAALVLLLIAISFPFLAVAAAGIENAMTLTEAMTSLSRFGADAIAVLVMAFVLLVPAAMMAAVVLLTTLIQLGYRTPFLVPLARTLFHLNAWCMADVFAIGVIISLVKLSSMADVELGIAFWSYLGFAVCFLLAVTSLDRISTWRAIDGLRRGQ